MQDNDFRGQRRDRATSDSLASSLHGVLFHPLLGNANTNILHTLVDCYCDDILHKFLDKRG
ncbi:MAG: hypothetical protein KME22_28970 [Hassallia sp. WJT32-NPBG1]|nr:hypothetical protein [Hassallia sp. WJT32-NPBG1]